MEKICELVYPRRHTKLHEGKPKLPEAIFVFPSSVFLRVPSCAFVDEKEKICEP